MEDGLASKFVLWDWVNDIPHYVKQCILLWILGKISN